jgi:hypothetical protein
LAIKFGIKKPEDWYKIPRDMVIREGGHFLKKHYNSSMIQGKTLDLKYSLCSTASHLS